MRLHGLWSTLACLASVTSAIFVDEAFHVDYHHALLGRAQSHATFVHKPQATTNASLLYTISDKAVLGAINPRDGTLLWRHALGGRPLDNATTSYLAHGERDGQIISGHGDTVSAWDAFDGRLIWDYTLPAGTTVGGLQVVPASASSTEQDSPQDVVVLAAPLDPSSHSILLRVAGDGSGAKWQHKDATSGKVAAASIVVTATQVFHVVKSDGLLVGGKARVATLNVDTGKEAGSNNIAVDSEGLGGAGLYTPASCASLPFLISAEKPYTAVKVTLLSTSKTVTLSLDDKNHEIEQVRVHYPCEATAATHLLLYVKSKTAHWAEVYHVNAKAGTVTKAYTLEPVDGPGAVATSSEGANLYFVRSTAGAIELYSSASGDKLASWKRDASLGDRRPVHAVAEVVRRGTGFAVRVAESSETGEWTMIRDGEPQWHRPEHLAYVSVAAWSDKPAPDSLADDLEVESTINPLTAYLHRVKRHANDLLSLPEYLQGLPSAILSPSTEADGSARKKLLGSKWVVVGTTRNELGVLEASNAGKVRWWISLSEYCHADAAIQSVVVNGARAEVYFSDGSVVYVGTSAGDVLFHSEGHAPQDRLLVIPGSPAHTVVRVAADGTPRVDGGSTPREGHTVVTIDDKGEAVGWAIGSSVEKLWTVRPKEGFRITDAVGRPAHDPVASSGKVLGDRSVLYKYISPNMALLVARAGASVTLYLVDGVTGAVLHTTSHEGVVPGSPIPAVVSENWFAFAFTSQDPSDSGLSTQLVISELYESDVPNDRGPLSAQTNYSSFSADAGGRPHVVSLAYTVADPISHLTVTQTAQGITSRQLLATLADSNAIVAIPREILNARRPVDRAPTKNEQEEGLSQYSSPLEVEPRNWLSHSREVLGVKELMVAPTLLESTSMVFAFGHDIFGSQVTPSNAFDVLGKGFNRVSLILTVVGLALGVVLIRPLVRQKTVKGRWTA